MADFGGLHTLALLSEALLASEAGDASPLDGVTDQGGDPGAAAQLAAAPVAAWGAPAARDASMAPHAPPPLGDPADAEARAAAEEVQRLFALRPSPGGIAAVTRTGQVTGRGRSKRRGGGGGSGRRSAGGASGTTSSGGGRGGAVAGGGGGRGGAAASSRLGRPAAGLNASSLSERTVLPPLPPAAPKRDLSRASSAATTPPLETVASSSLLAAVAGAAAAAEAAGALPSSDLQDSVAEAIAQQLLATLPEVAALLDPLAAGGAAAGPLGLLAANGVAAALMALQQQHLVAAQAAGCTGREEEDASRAAAPDAPRAAVQQQQQQQQQQASRAASRKRAAAGDSSEDPDWEGEEGSDDAGDEAIGGDQVTTSGAHQGHSDGATLGPAAKRARAPLGAAGRPQPPQPLACSSSSAGGQGFKARPLWDASGRGGQPSGRVWRLHVPPQGVTSSNQRRWSPYLNPARPGPPSGPAAGQRLVFRQANLGASQQQQQQQQQQQHDPLQGRGVDAGRRGDGGPAAAYGRSGSGGTAAELAGRSVVASDGSTLRQLQQQQVGVKPGAAGPDGQLPMPMALPIAVPLPVALPLAPPGLSRLQQLLHLRLPLPRPPPLWPPTCARRPGEPLPRQVVFVWSLEEALSPLRALLQAPAGSAEQQGSRALGLRLRRAILELGDNHLHLKKLEPLEPLCAEDLWECAEAAAARAESAAAAKEEPSPPQRQETRPPAQRHKGEAPAGVKQEPGDGAGPGGEEAKQQEHKAKAGGQEGPVTELKIRPPAPRTRLSEAAQLLSEAAAAYAAGADALPAGPQLVELRRAADDAAGGQLSRLRGVIRDLSGAAGASAAAALAANGAAAANGASAAAPAGSRGGSGGGDGGVGPVLSHVAVGRVQLVEAMAEMAALGLNSTFTTLRVYSASRATQLACFQRIADRHGAATRFVAVGGGPEAEAAARLIGWRFVRLAAPPGAAAAKEQPAPDARNAPTRAASEAATGLSKAEPMEAEEAAAEEGPEPQQQAAAEGGQQEQGEGTAAAEPAAPRRSATPPPHSLDEAAAVAAAAAPLEAQRRAAGAADAEAWLAARRRRRRQGAGPAGPPSAGEGTAAAVAGDAGPSVDLDSTGSARHDLAQLTAERLLALALI